MSKRKTSMGIDDVMNDINTWLGEESDDEAEMISMKLLVIKMKKLILVKKNILEDEIDLEVESSSSQNRYIFGKQLEKKTSL